MREAIVTVRDVDGTALGLSGVFDILEAAGLRDLEVMSCEGARGVVRVSLDSELDEPQLEAESGISWVERVATANGHAYLIEFSIEDAPDMIEACGPDVLECVTLDATDREFTFGVAGSQAAIAETIAEYEAAGATVQLESLRDFQERRHPLDSLTDRQREILQVAYDMGYFDVPRSATTGEIAASMAVDPSTVSEHLQRAEHNLLSTMLPSATV